MPTDADAPFAVQPPLTLAATARVLEQLIPAAGVAVSKDDVRNELLKRRILLHLFPRAVTHIRRFQQRAEIAIHVGREALEVPQLVKDLGRHDEDLFELMIGHVRVSVWGSAKRFAASVPNIESRR